VLAGDPVLLPAGGALANHRLKLVTGLEAVKVTSRGTAS
jgi:hypothetical protein